MAHPLVTRYLLAFKQYQWFGVGGFVAVLGIAGVLALQPPPPVTFRGEAVLGTSGPPVAFSQTGTDIQAQGREIDQAFLLSPAILEFTVNSLTTEGIAIEPGELLLQTEVRILSDEISGALEGVRVVYISEDQVETEAALRYLVQGMLQQSEEVNKGRLQGVIAAISDRLPAVETELREAEQQLEAYDREEGPAIQAALDGSLLGSITGSEQQRRQLRLTLSGIAAQMQSLQARLGLTPEQAYASSALSVDPIIADLRARLYQTESQIEILAQNLRPEHPTMVELRQQQSAYGALLSQRASEVIGGNQAAPLIAGNTVRQDSNLDPARQQLANQLVALQTQQETLIQQLGTLEQTEQELRQQYAGLPNKQLERNRLAQIVAQKRAIYDQMIAKRIDAQAAEAETVSSLRIAQPPQIRQVDPEVTASIVVLIIGGVLGLVVGGAIIFLLDAIDGTLRTVGDIQTLLREQDVPILGLIPTLPLESGRSLPILSHEQSPHHEAYERFRSNLNRAAGDRPIRVVLVTSTIPAEGKSTTAFNLAIAAARAGKRTLLVEGDLRLPTHAWEVDVEPKGDRSVEPLHYYGDTHSCVAFVPAVENLYLAASVAPQRQAAAILESSEMQRFMTDSRGRFDLVVVDAPALSTNNDALILERFTDGILLVARPGVSQSSLLSEALEELTESEDIQFLGAVINGADQDTPPEPIAAAPPPPALSEYEAPAETTVVGDRTSARTPS